MPIKFLMRSPCSISSLSQLTTEELRQKGLSLGFLPVRKTSLDLDSLEKNLRSKIQAQVANIPSDWKQKIRLPPPPKPPVPPPSPPVVTPDMAANILKIVDPNTSRSQKVGAVSNIVITRITGKPALGFVAEVGTLAIMNSRQILTELFGKNEESREEPKFDTSTSSSAENPLVQTEENAVAKIEEVETEIEVSEREKLEAEYMALAQKLIILENMHKIRARL